MYIFFFNFFFQAPVESLLVVYIIYNKNAKSFPVTIPQRFRNCHDFLSFFFAETLITIAGILLNTDISLSFLFTKLFVRFLKNMCFFYLFLSSFIFFNVFYKNEDYYSVNTIKVSIYIPLIYCMFAVNLKVFSRRVFLCHMDILSLQKNREPISFIL